MNVVAFEEAKKHNPRLRRAVVRAIDDITPNMRRVVLGGPDLDGFPTGMEGGYIKFVFVDLPDADPSKPVMRTYSIRAHNAEAGKLSVDFALHADTGGIAMDWVSHVKAGDEVAFMGPGKVKMAPPDADWYLIAADMTGLPAALCNIEMLPHSARGHAVFEVATEADKQDIAVPEGVALHWVVNPTPQELNNALLDRIKALDWLEGAPFVWTACEFDTMRALRTYYRTDRAVDRTSIYLSSYWRVGRSEDQHKVDKRKDADDNAPVVESLARGVVEGVRRLTGR
ncbi:MAG: siderophore-interacting protein [Pseudomonadota bacterium]